MKPHFFRDGPMWCVRFENDSVYPLCWEAKYLAQAYGFLLQYTLPGFKP